MIPLHQLFFAVIKFDSTTVAQFAMQKENKWIAIFLLLVAGFSRPWQVDIVEQYGKEQSEYTMEVTRIFGVFAKPIIAVIFSVLNVYVFRAFDKPMQFWWSFNVIGMACIWDILGWAVSFVRPSLPIGFLSYLLTALTITTVMSEMSFVGVPGTFLALLLSSLCAVMCGFMCILALLGTVVGLLAGFVAAAGGEMPEGFWSFEMN